MSVNGRSAAPRRFVAASPAVGAKMEQFVTGKRTGVFYAAYAAVAAAIFALTLLRNLKPWMTWGLSAVIAVAVVGSLVGSAHLWMRSRRTILLDVTADGLTVNGLPGTVFPFSGAQLGPWARMGVALHLQSGSRRFVLGARDRRIAPSTRLDAPAVSAVDGWLWASDFDELLAIGGPRSGVDVRGPAQAEPTRCLLFPNPYLAEEFGSMAFRRHLRFQRSRPQPSLFVDVDGDAIRVIDPHSNAPGASAWVTQVAATPATFQPDSVTSGDGSTYSYPAIGGLIVCFPGTQPLTIGCLDRARSQFRFCWSAGVPRANQRADYVVSGGDWLTLVERFGLTAHLQDRATPEDRR